MRRHLGRAAQFRRWFEAKRLVSREDVRHGFRKLPEVFMALFEGANNGSLLVTADESGLSDR